MGRSYGAVGVGERHLADGKTLQRGVEGLCDEDGAGDAQVGLAGDKGCGAEVGRSANALEDAGERDEGLDIGVREVVGARLHWSDSSGLESTSEELDVLLLIVGDVLEVVVVVRAVACWV